MRITPTEPAEISQYSSADLLKVVLENLAAPERLDLHPWAQSAFVFRECEAFPSLDGRTPGLRLAIAVTHLFRRTLPGGPPRQGKRLDTRWGEFGLLASRYFAPFYFGLPYPTSLREAWQGIDRAIQLFAFEDNPHASEAERLPYRLVANEMETAPESTLSDWQRKGIQRLAEAIEARENSLENLALLKAAPLTRNASNDREAVTARRRKSLQRSVRLSLLVLAALVIAALVWGGLKARRVYEIGLALREDAAAIQELAGSTPDLEGIRQAGPLLPALRRDLGALEAEAGPYLWIMPWLSWVPTYGGDLSSTPYLLEMADLLLESAEHSYAAFRPLLDALGDPEALDPAELTGFLTRAEPEVSRARVSFDRFMEIRQGLDLASLSPGVRSRIDEDLDPLLPRIDDGLSAALALPGFLGASSDGPKTYLILVQNEDELRPTGGFITAAGTLVVHGGEVVSFSFEDTGDLDNWAKPYPAAPWQLQEYMNSPVLVLRDANWFTDFPTTALYTEYLYAYTHAHSVDGVIALDQQMLVLMLKATGPLPVEGATEPVSAENVISYMRSAKSRPAGQTTPEGWSRKGFMDKITGALMTRIFSGGVNWRSMGEMILQGLDERHLLLQMDDPALNEVLSRRGWNGALRPGPADFLMVADSNIGFNKTNAVVETRLFYDVDLTNPAAPTAQLTVVHQNNASSEVKCIQWGLPRLAGQNDYPIDACYWDYMRLYRPAGTELLDASPQAVPAAWMILEEAVDARVDVLEEEIEGVQAFGTLLVVPGGESLSTGFEFALPASVLQPDPDSEGLMYALRVLKQPGTLAIPLTVRVHLPAGALIRTTTPAGLVQDKDVLIETDLRTDLELRIVFVPR